MLTAFVAGEMVVGKRVDFARLATASPRLQAVLRGGKVLAAYRPTSSESELHGTAPVRFVVARSDGSVEANLGVSQRARTTLQLSTSEGLSYTSVPALENIAIGSLFDLSSDARTFAIAGAPTQDGTTRLTIWDLLTLKSRQFDIPLRVARVSQKDIESIAQDLAKSHPALGAHEHAKVSRAIREQVRPTILPPITALTVANSGDLWLKRNGVGVQTGTWLRFDPTKSLSKQFQLSPLERVAAADSQYVVTIGPSADGIPRLRLYKILTP